MLGMVSNDKEELRNNPGKRRTLSIVTLSDFN